MLRVTPDTNVLVEATISSTGPAGEILVAWAADRLALVTCEEIVAKYEEVLRRPHIRSRYAHITDRTIANSGTALRQYSEFVTLTSVPQVIAEDPDDDVVLACAVAGGADYIISRDHHLLDIHVHQGIPVVTAGAFLQIFRGHVREEREVFVSSGAAR